MQAQLVQYFVTSLFHDFRTWVHVFVNAVTEAHQAVFTLFHAFHEFGNVFNRTDFIQHFQHSFVRATVSRAPQASDTSGDGCKWVGA